ncbi:MAG: hypothetical protein ACRDLD_02190 [Thermoleophilaceae bacterium]
MAETVANLLDLLKEVWTQDRLEGQFYNENRWLDKVEKTNKYTIGRQAQVPVELSLPGGSTTHTAAGGALNPADALHVDRADYTLVYEWQQVEIEAGALNQADTVGERSTIDAADQTIASNVGAMRRNLGRQFVSNQDALIAECATTTTSNTVSLRPTGYGFGAIERGWLRPGMLIDIGTTASESSVAADRSIVSVNESDTAPSIVIDGATVTTTATGHFVSVANARAGTTSNEANGLRQMAGSETTVVGTIDPASVGQWVPAHVDTATTLVSLDLLLTLQRKVFQKTGKWPTYVTTSPYQAAQLYSQFQSQVRFSDDKTAAGNAHGFKWNGMEIAVDPDIPDRELYMLTLSDFFVVTGGKFGKPTWASEVQGASRGMLYKQGFTSFVDALTYPCQLAAKRRSSHASAIGLTG